MVWEGVNKVYVKQARDGRNGGTDTLNSIQYLICNAFFTSAESPVQCCISHSTAIHDVVRQWILHSSCLSQDEPESTDLIWLHAN